MKQQYDNDGHIASREHGAALVIVLGLVALVASWATTAAFEDLIAIRQAENMKDAMYAAQANQSLFSMAKMRLRNDAREGLIVDDLDEEWAEEMQTWPVDHGVVSGRIEDANRYFNLNDLVDELGVAREQQVQICRRLFAGMDIDVAIVDALVDWMDADDQSYGVGGAEDAAYLARSYRIKNARMDRWDELNMVQGMDGLIMNKLARVACVRPVTNQSITTVNINTASAKLIAALFEHMDESDAEQLVAGRPYKDISTAMNHFPWENDGATSLLGVSSDAFVITADAEFGRARLSEKYLVLRQGTKLTLLARERLGWGEGDV